MLRNSLFLLAVILALPAFRAAAQSKPQSAAAAQAAAVPPRITQAIDETQLQRLKGNVHPLARQEFDQGAVNDATPMSRMLLLLKRSPEQDAALQKLMGEQQSKDSPNFHQWLTPQQFGAQFGPADADVQAVTDWLTRQGFHGIKVGSGRTTIEFSGNVSQVRNAFHTEVHHFTVNGEAHMANVGDPQIPAALSPVVAGVVSLHNFRHRPHAHLMGTFRRTKATGEVTPLFTYTSSNGTFFGMGPADFGKIYNVPATINSNPAGQGQTIAIVGRTNINIQDVRDFRSMFGLPVNDPQIILNGPDPGIVSPGEETEADLDVEWSGAVAPNATIKFVVSESTQSVASDGVDLSAVYIVDDNIAPVMSESFGSCEASLTTAGNRFFNSLWQQAAAEGITVVISSGDSGSAGCDPPAGNPNETAASRGIAISGIASTPFNVAVGGTDFDDSVIGYPSLYWNTTNTATTPTPVPASALSYIPEVPWNDSCAAAGSLTGCATVSASGQNIVAAGGGPSSVYSGSLKPSWQTGLGDTSRDIPDVSLFASNGHHRSFYIICQSDQDPAGGTGCNLATSATSPNHDFQGVGGTSASTPPFAAIIALINQKTGQRQGNANPVLYALAAKTGNSCTSNPSAVTNTSCVFYDVAKSNNSVACQGGSLNCSNQTAGQVGIMTTVAGGTTPAFNATAGYDMATGLGSVNVTNLANSWSSITFKSSTTAITNSPTTALAHGAPANFTVTVTATGTPTGSVSLIASPPGFAQQAIGPFALTSGVATISTNELPGGTSYPVVAHYAGDGTFGASDSAAVNVTVNKESSLTKVSLWTFGPTGAVISQNATSAVYGSPYILRVDVTNSSGQQCSATPVPCPTGNVTLTDNNSPLNDFVGPTNTASLNNLGLLEDQPIQLPGGSHSIVATYAGDNSYNGSTSPADTLTISTATTATVLTPGATTVQPNQGITLSVAISSQSNSTLGPTGNVTFKDGTATIGTAQLIPAGATATAGASATAILNTSFATTASHTLTAVYAGDQNYAASTSAGVTVTVGQPTTISATSSATSIASGGSVTLTATVATTSHGAGPTGTVQFRNGTSALSTAVTCTPTAGTSTTTASCTATLTTTLAFLAPPSIPNRVPNMRFHPVVLVAFLLLLLILISLSRIPAAHRRIYECAALLLLAGLVASLAGCGSGYGGGGGGGPHYDSITAVYGGDATYAGSTSPAITITVQ
jgi:hypothetical protein